MLRNVRVVKKRSEGVGRELRQNIELKYDTQKKEKLNVCH